MAIDIGAGAAAYNWPVGTYTWLDQTNPANADGVIDQFEVYVQTNASGAKIGTFYGSGTSWTVRDFEAVGSISTGSKQTFTGLSCNANANDIIGFYASSGNLYSNTTGGSGILYASGDNFSGGAASYTADANYKLALYGTGYQFPLERLIKTINSLAVSSVKTINGLAIASIKTMIGL